MFRKIIFLIPIILLVAAGSANAQREFTRTSSAPGAFSRMGFGARGIAMGNALSAVNTGNLVAYYNPAVSVFQEENSFSTAYTFLGLDRSLNFLNFTRKFEFGKNDSALENKRIRPAAGLSVGIINAGVSDIEQRDNQGMLVDNLSTSENQAFLGLALRLSNKVALGISAKFFYYYLFEDVTSSGFGLDAGMLYTVNDALKFSFVLTDLNSKYEWDTSDLYGEDGRPTTNQFPLIKKIGASYHLKEQNLLIAAEYAFDNFGAHILRFGGEYVVMEQLSLRAGIDNFHLENQDELPHPSFGFSYIHEVAGLMLGVDYAFMIEQYSSMDRHIVGISVIF